MVSPQGSSIFGGLRVWVDAPLDGTVVKVPVQCSLVCPGTDGSGVQALVEVSAKGQLPGTEANPDAGAALINASRVWEPPEPGTYKIRCRAQHATGEWSGYADARVRVVQGAVTITPTSTPTPMPLAAGLVFTTRVSTTAFEYQRDCVPDPSEVTITALQSSASSVKDGFLFFRLESSALGVTTDWNEGLAMASVGGGAYRATVSWEVIPQLSQIWGSSATFEYQFVAAGRSNENLGRSQVFRNVTIGPCQ